MRMGLGGVQVQLEGVYMVRILNALLEVADNLGDGALRW
jgi:hypothetical protein